MFKKAFIDLVSKYSDNDDLPESYWQEILTAYSKPGRYYHNLTHLENLYKELLPLQESILVWDIVLLSIAYHDIIYNPVKKDNEEKSADLASARIIRLQIEDEKRESCRKQIIATKNHNKSPDPDTNYFTDADLSILGASPENYSIYIGQIRKEYKIYPDFLYNPGRRKVLKSFLNMPCIYKTDHFHKLYEEQARINISSEIKMLEA